MEQGVRAGEGLVWIRRATENGVINVLVVEASGMIVEAF